MHLIESAHYEVYCQKCKKKVMTIKETLEEFEKSQGELDT